MLCLVPCWFDYQSSRIVLKKMSENHIRVATLGNVDAGKSTLTGTLISGKLDDGRGSSRAAITKHKHELITGRTSTIGTHLLGLNENSKPITSYSSQSDLIRKSNRLITLMDLAGHEKYLKTTIAGIARGMADYALVLVNAMQPPTHMTMHHLKLCVTLGIPAIVVMTKVSNMSPVVDTTAIKKKRLQPKFSIDKRRSVCLRLIYQKSFLFF